MSEQVRQSGKWFGFFERAALWLVGGSLVILPVFFIPVLAAPFLFTKMLLVAVAVLAAIVLFSISRLREGSVTVPKSVLFGTVWLLPLAYLASAVLSSDASVSFFGQALDVDTFSFTLLGAFVASLAIVLFRTTGQMFAFYLGMLGVFTILALFQCVRLIGGPDFLSFGILTDQTANVLGKWNDLGIFFGLSAILALVTLEHFNLNRVARGVFYGVVLLALFFLSLVNLPPVWAVLIIFMLGFVVSGLSKRLMGKEVLPSQRLGASVASLTVIIISLVFLFGGDAVKRVVMDTFNVNYIEARPSWQSTVAVGREVFRESPIFGSGPNTFAAQWSRHRPAGINTTAFWNTDFTLGVGIVPTAFVTGGLAVGFAWMLFFSAFLYTGIRSLIVGSVRDHIAHYVALSSFLGALYLWVLSVVYTPNAVILLLAFLLTGIFLASLRSQSFIRETTIVFDDQPRVGFVASLALTLCIIGSAAGLYLVVERYVGAVFFQRAILAANVTGNLDAAERSVIWATRLNGDGRTYRLAANVAVARLSAIVASTPDPTDEARSRFQSTLSSAVQYGGEATRIEPENYQSWLTLGNIYHAVTPLGLRGAYEGARAAYERAAVLAPTNPSIALTLARLEVANGSTKAAREQIARALEMKPDYTEAAFFLSQIEVQEGNIDRAITSVESASFLSPLNPVVFFQLGFLKYNKPDNRGAILSLERAVELNADYANARYFLGLAYYRADRVNDAIAQFKRIAELNPENTDVKNILENLRGGRSPFASAAVAPEKQRGLPVAE